MRAIWFTGFALGVLALSSCSMEPYERPGSEPAPAAGMARFYFYRELAPYGSLEWTAISLNHQRVGDSAPGTVFYRDVSPGTYEIEVRSERLYPNQFKTVAVGPGSKVFAKIQEQPSWGKSAWGWQGTTFVVSIIDPVVATQEISRLRLSPG